MHLDADEIVALAEFFARRFPDEGERSTLAARAQVDDVAGSPVEAWTAILDAAQARGTLRPLAAAAARDAGADANLRELLRILSDDGRPSRAPLVAGLVAMGLAGGLAVGLLALVALGIGRGGSVEEAPEVAVASPAPAVPIETAVAAAVAAPAPVEVPVAPAPEPVAATVAPKPIVAARARAVVDPGRCAGDGAGLVGWFYAGTRSPGAKGATIVLDAAVNVRADPPSAANHFDTSAPIRCHLSAGDVIRLSHEPLFVPRDAWWVPLHVGDLQGVVAQDGAPVADRG